MAAHTLPLLFVNLGGEMLYVLSQRLDAQSVGTEKSQKVMSDIVTTMFSSKFMSEIMRPQEIFARQNMRIIFDKLVHVSIMRLNSVSMDKLYDLMVMAVKYQILFCSKPKELLLVTYNHLDSIRKLLPPSSTSNTVQLVDNVHREIDKGFGSMTSGQLQRLRSALLVFFEDLHIRVSVFLRDKIQTQTGAFIIQKSRQLAHGIDAPGSMRLYNSSGKWLKTKAFTPGATFTPPGKSPSYGLTGDRATKLGLNLYEDVKGENSVTSTSPTHDQGSPLTGSKRPQVDTIMSSDLDKLEIDKNATKELEILQGLLGHIGAQNKRSGATFSLDLFDRNSNTTQTQHKPLPAAMGSSVSKQAERINVDRIRNPKLNSVAAEMTFDSSISSAKTDKGDDLLDLLDRS